MKLRAIEWIAIMSKQTESARLYESSEREAMFWLSSAKHLKHGADLVRSELDKVLAIYAQGRASYDELSLLKPYMFLDTCHRFVITIQANPELLYSQANLVTAYATQQQRYPNIS